MTKDEILAALPKLSHGDLAAVHAVADHLLGGVKAAEGGLPSTLSQLGQAVFNALLTALGAPKAPVNPTLRAKVDKRAAELSSFLDQHFKGWSDNKLTQHAFLVMLMRLLVSDINKRMGGSPTIGIMINQLGRLPEVFENAFPDYLENGFGPFILNRFKKKVSSGPPQMG